MRGGKQHGGQRAGRHAVEIVEARPHHVVQLLARVMQRLVRHLAHPAAPRRRIVKRTRHAHTHESTTAGISQYTRDEGCARPSSAPERGGERRRVYDAPTRCRPWSPTGATASAAYCSSARSPRRCRTACRTLTPTHARPPSNFARCRLDTQRASVASSSAMASGDAAPHHMH